jgi:general secretion pathway protein H
MPISIAERLSDAATADPARRPRSAGFTLLEIALVLLIIGIVLALAIPRLRSISGAELRGQARRLTNTFRYLRSEAILTGRIYQLRYDLTRERYWVTIATDAGDLSQAVADTGLLGRAVSLPSPVGISDIVVGGTQKIQQGLAMTNFYPDGYIDPTVIHIDDGREAFTLYVNALTGRASLAKGYYDVDYGK